MQQREIGEIVQRQRAFFAGGGTKDPAFRREQLRILKSTIEKRESEIMEALRRDLGKPPFEAYTAEVGFVLRELDCALKNLHVWSRARRVPTPLINFPGRSFILPEPFGVALIIGPWNYPFQLLFSPLIGAIAAGNCAVIKPSEAAPSTSSVILSLVNENFEESFISVVEGDAEAARLLLEEKFDYIFFTGGAVVGRLVMQAAARHLTPLTLELGGKNPCIVEKDAPLEASARKIAWGKFMNAGQLCVAPDYLLAHRSIREKLVGHITSVLRKFYGEDPQKSPDYARIINERHFSRLSALLGKGRILLGGQTDAATRYIAPTLLDGISWEDPIMQEEIFGPILPILEYDDLDEALRLLSGRPRPLALYFFSQNRALQEQILRDTSSGGVCINETVSHIISANLPFGGVGESGMGAYHGRESFNTFSHLKSVLRKGFFPDLPLKYPPYNKSLGLVKTLLKYFS
jgi:aldehyde dehydrogenase (NAD+)